MPSAAPTTARNSPVGAQVHAPWALAVAGAEKILRREVDAKAHADLLDGIKKQL